MGSIIGIDIGGTNVRAALANDKGQILSRLDEKTDKLSGPKGLSRQIIHMIHSLKTFEIDSIGIGSAGPLDLKEGSIVNSPHLGYKRIPLVRPLKSEFNIPVYLANDCVAGVVAEKEYGQGKKYSNLVYVTMSTGIGAGVYADGRLLLGKDGNAHEIGHITIDYTGALTCGCGCKGHWEAYCGGENAQNFIKYQLEKKKLQDIESSLIYRISGGDFTRLSSQDLFESAQKRDAIASAIVEEMGRLNAIGFANITNAYDPEIITIGGAIALANPNLILDPVKKLIGYHIINRVPQIKLTELGGDIVLLGAIALSKQFD